MHDNPTGANDYLVIVYARLIDPEVWPVEGDPEVDPATAGRLLRSLEAAYRIADHLGQLADRSDIVGRLSAALAIGDEPVLDLPDMDPQQAAGLVAVLMGEIGEDDAPPAEDEAHDDVAPTPTPVDEPMPEWPEPDEAIDPDHDPEAGISHVGDADEGQHHEEQR